jgi:hypothetical protein
VNKRTTSLISLIALGAAMVWGMLAQRNHWPPYQLVKGALDLASPPPGGGHLRPDPALVEQIDPRYREVDPLSLVHAADPYGFEELRAELLVFLFGGYTLPATLPHALGPIEHADFGREVGVWEVRMDHGLTSTVFDLPGDGPVVLYHQGHGETTADCAETVRALNDAGCRVLVLAMPLESRNPGVKLPGGLELDQHIQLGWIDDSAGHPVRLLVEPVIVMLNELEAQGEPGPTTMIGLSGGGWTTTLAAAIDTRINLSIPVAGTLPLWLRTGVRGDWGDWEQNLPGLYSRWSYLDLYILGATGEGRAQLQILNQYDPVCFAGIRSQLYGETVSRIVDGLGAGGFEVFVDDTHARHDISVAARARILELIRGL